MEYLEKANPTYYSLVKLDFERAWFAKFESLLDVRLLGRFGWAMIESRQLWPKACATAMKESTG